MNCVQFMQLSGVSMLSGVQKSESDSVEMSELVEYSEDSVELVSGCLLVVYLFFLPFNFNLRFTLFFFKEAAEGRPNFFNRLCKPGPGFFIWEIIFWPLPLHGVFGVCDHVWSVWFPYSRANLLD